MNPRIAMFQRKGAAIDETNDAGPEALSEDSPMPEGAEGAVMCPNCQCEFDPATGEVLNAQEDVAGEAYEISEGIMPGGEG